MATTAKKKPLSKKTTLYDEREGAGLVDPKLLRHLQNHFGFDGFKQNQGAIIKSVLSGKDTFVIMPTGGGKSPLLPATGHDERGRGHYREPPDRPDEKPGRPGAGLQFRRIMWRIS